MPSHGWSCNALRRVVTVTEPTGVRASDAVSALLTGHALEFYEDLRLVPLLRRLIQASCRLTGAVGGSISLVGSDRAHYTKAAERGTSCRLGQIFPLDEGVTGLVVRERRPVVLERYRDIAVGHVPEGNEAWDRAVAAIPIWWRGDVIGVNVVFAGQSQQFTGEEIELLEALTQLVAPGLVAAAQRDLALDYFTDYRAPFGSEPLGLADEATSGAASVAKVALDLVVLTDQATLQRSSPHTSFHVELVPSETGVRLLVQEDLRDESTTVPSAPDPSRWQELVDRQGGGVEVKQVAAHESVGRFDGSGAAPTGGRSHAQSPFSPREKQVLDLVARGLSDRAIAEELVISSKTVEKHVGAVLRKTGTTSRTAAVMCALAAGWLNQQLLTEGLLSKEKAT